jgi:tRNA threonylcarbamoyl adenosine modification protein YeaZ
MAADVVIVNHHLLLADMVLREEGFGQLLPGADAVIVDEAHQLPETAVGFFGVNVGSRQLDGLAADAVAEGLKAGLSLSELEPLADALTRATAEARLQLAGREGRQPWSAAAGIDDVVEDLGAAVTALAESVRPMSQQEPGIEALIRRADAAGAALETLAGREDEDCIRWFESFRRSFALHSTPVDVSEALGEKIRTQCGTWIFTSATLAVGDDFSHSAGRLGLPEADCLQLDSPFDFARQSRLFLPAGLPAPADPGYTDRVLDAVEPVLAASGGRAFLLFTSHRALRLAAERLRDAGPPLGDYPLLIQGDAPRDQLLQRFREFGNAILLGTSSFWEGVRARRCARRRGDRQAAVRLPRRSPDECPAGRHPAVGWPALPRLPVAPGRHRAEAGGRPADPRLRGSRHRGVVRPAAEREELRTGVPRQPARDADHAGGRGDPGIPRRGHGGGAGVKLLAIETATDACSVALQRGDTVVEQFSAEPRAHADRVLRMVEDCLAEASIALADLDALVFGRGPGSFTGVRIAAGVVQGLALGADLPVVPVSTLAGYAVATARVHDRRRVAVAVDARMGECYWGAYEVEDGLARSRVADLIAEPSALASPGGNGWVGDGSGWAAFPALADEMPGVAVLDAALLPRAGDLLHNGADELAQGNGLKAEDALPLYLRDKVAWRSGN